MKYKDPITDELKDIYIKAVDTLPPGIITEYDGEGVPDGWEEVGYSFTEEKVIGKHTNGKALYHRYILDTTKNADLSSLNYDFIHLRSCSVMTQAFIFTGARYLGNGDTIECFINNNTKGLQTVVGSAWENSYVMTSAEIIYTKTTDTPTNKKTIRKKSSTIGVTAQVVNERSESANSVYSCEFSNGTKLWTNPIANVVFEAQDIQLDLTDYKYIEIYYAYSMESLEYIKMAKVEVGKNSTLEYIAEGVNLSCRNLQTTFAGIHFDNTFFNGDINNSFCIPMEIIGYK